MASDAAHEGVCPFCQERLQVWHHVPVDCLRQRPNPHAQVYWCADCAYGSVQPLPSVDEVAEFYRFDEYYTHQEPVQVSGDEQKLLDRLRVHLAFRFDRGYPLTEQRVHQVMQGKRSAICDLGSGGGDLALALSALGHDVTGVELDPDAASRKVQACGPMREQGVEECGFSRVRSAPGSLQFMCGSAEELPPELSKYSFDCVILRHVLEHCRNPQAALHNARALLRAGGVLICEVPNNDAFGLRTMGSAWAMFDVPRHLHFFTRKSLVCLCERAGFRVQEPYFANYHRQFTNGWIDTERTLFSRLMSQVEPPVPQPVENSRLRAWGQLFGTLVLPAERKYDSVGVIAVPLLGGA